MNQAKLDKYSRIALLAIFFIPLIITPGVLFPYQYGKVLLFEAMIGLLAAGTLWWKKDLKIRTSPIFWVLVAYIAVRLITGITGANPEKSFWGDHIRMTGTFTFLAMFLFFLLLRDHFYGKEKEFKLLRFIAYSGAFGALFALLQRFTVLGEWIFGRSDQWIFGSFGNPSYLAGFLVLVIFFTAILIFHEKIRKNKIIWSTVLAGEFALLIATSARGAIVGLLMGAITAGITLLIVSKNKKTRLAGVLVIGAPILVLAFSLFVYFGPGRASPLGKIMGSLLRAGTAETRMINWRIAVDGFLARPTLGWGPENYEIIFSKFYRPELLKYTYTETWSDRPHNILLEIAGGSGLPGLLSFGALFVIPLYFIIRKTREKDNNMPSGEMALSVGGLVAYLGQGLFLFDTFSTLLLFTALLAYLDMRFTYAFAPEAQTVPAKPMPSFFRKVFAGASLAAVVFGAILPAKASHFADRMEADIAKRDFTNFEQDMHKALTSWTPHHDDLAKILADEVLKDDAAGRIPRESVKAILPELAEFVGNAANANNQVYALLMRSGQLYSLAGEYLDPKYFKKSEEMFNKMELLSPDRQTGLIMRVQMEIARGSLDEAVKRSSALVEANPDFLEGYWLHGMVLAAAGREDEAEQMFDKSLTRGIVIVANTNQGILRKTGFVLDFYVSRGKFEKAIPILEWLIKGQHADLDIYMRLAGVYAATGRFEEARATALQIILLDPGRRAEIDEFVAAIEDLSTRTQ